MICDHAPTVFKPMICDCAVTVFKPVICDCTLLLPDSERWWAERKL